MKKLDIRIYLVGLLLLIMIMSCTKSVTPNNKVLVISGVADTIRVDVNKKDVVAISKDQADLINSFRTPLRDIAYYEITHKQSCKISRFYLEIGTNRFWIANGYSHFALQDPIEINLKSTEKRYFWGIYKKMLVDHRLYKYEDDVKIIIK